MVYIRRARSRSCATLDARAERNETSPLHPPPPTPAAYSLFKSPARSHSSLTASRAASLALAWSLLYLSIALSYLSSSSASSAASSSGLSSGS